MVFDHEELIYFIYISILYILKIYNTLSEDRQHTYNEPKSDPLLAMQLYRQVIQLL